jgi:hypothetical protein
MTKEQKAVTIMEGYRAAGYCAVWNGELHAICTRQPGHDGDHVSRYRGRKSVADTEGHRWRQ